MPSGGRPIQRNLKEFNNGIPVYEKKTATFLKNKVAADFYSGLGAVAKETQTPKETAKYYLDFCRQRIGAETVKIYGYYLDNFITWANVAKVSAIRERIVSDYLTMRRRDHGISARTANATVKILNQFLNFCVRQNIIQANPIKGMALQDVQQKIPEFLEPNELKQVLKEARETNLYPIIATAIYTGMRRSSLLRMQWPDVLFDKDAIILPTTKSRKINIVPLHSELKKLLWKIRKPSGPVFDAYRLRERFEEFRELSKVKKKFGWHTFRHSMVTNLIMDGVPVKTAGEIAGHSTVATTEIYTHLVLKHKN